jgi:phosphate-selective porin OprO/OprP
MSFSKRFGALLLCGAALGAGQAQAGTSNSAAADEIAQRLAALQQQIDDLNNTVADLKRSQSAQYADLQGAQSKQDTLFTMKNGRPVFRTSDGDFTLAIRALVQLDTAYYMQGFVPGSGVTQANTDFSSGTNFRRARAGIAGTLFKDWSYEFIYDFGGSGLEAASISSAFIQYDGLGPVHIKAGAYPTPESFDDSTSAQDLMFLERAQPTDLARSIAGSDGREGATIFGYDDNSFAALSYTGDLAGAASEFDEQQAVVGRVAYRFAIAPDVNLALGGDTTYVVKLPDLAAGPLPPDVLRLRERPELNVDDNAIRLIDTGSINASHYWEYGLEGAGNWHNLYGQGGYFHYDVTRRASPLPDPSFDGWYLQASWVLTGEAKPYRPERGAYSTPAPDHPFSFSKGDWGAWEIAGRYSDLDLDFDPGAAGSATPLAGIRGGEQRIWTGGLNWYPNAAMRFMLNYQHTDVTRLSVVGGSLDAKLDALSLRAQFAL